MPDIHSTPIKENYPVGYRSLGLRYRISGPSPQKRKTFPRATILGGGEMNIIYNVMNNLHSRRHSPNQLHDHIQCAATTCPGLRIRVVFIRVRIRLPLPDIYLASINKLIIIELFLRWTNSNTGPGEKRKRIQPPEKKKNADPQPCTCHMLKQEYRKLSRIAFNYIHKYNSSVHFFRSISYSFFLHRRKSKISFYHIYNFGIIIRKVLEVD